MTDQPSTVTAEISMYPLAPDVEPPILAFIRHLRGQPGVECVSNAMSTQVKGSFEDVHRAIGACMQRAMVEQPKVVFVTKMLNLDLAIDERPSID